MGGGGPVPLWPALAATRLPRCYWNHDVELGGRKAEGVICALHCSMLGGLFTVQCSHIWIADTIKFYFTNLSFNAITIWLLYHWLGNEKGINFILLRINIIFIPEFYKSEQMKGKMVGCAMRWTRTRPPLPRLTNWPWLGTFRPDPPHILILLIFSPPDNIF